MNAVAQIQVGRRVLHHGAYGARRSGVIASVGANHFDVVTFDGLQFESRESCIGKPGIGRIDLLDEILAPNVIETAKALVTDRLAREAADAAMAKQRHAEAIERVKAENPGLIPGGEYAGAAHAARNIRLEFKASGIKAGVRSRSFAGGDAIDIELPASASNEALAAAKRIARKYEAGHFNSMDDCYEYAASAWCDAFGAAKYVHVGRAYAQEPA